MAADLPQAAAPFVGFASLLRDNGFAVAPEQTMGFIEAVGLLGPTSMAAIRSAARAMLAPPADRHPEFDALFDAHFMGRALAAPTSGAPDEADDLLVQDARDGDGVVPEADDVRESGAQASLTETLLRRQFAALDQQRALMLFERAARAGLPHRRSYRRAPARRGEGLNMRRMLKDAARHDGEALSLPRLKRKARQRRVVLILDVSGSMKDQTDGALRFAHALARAAERFEAFTLGTRLTRITRAISLSNPDQALAAASGLVADWDGGTRIGDALQVFLATPRFAGFARGAYVLVVSDGLERGDPAAMIDAAAGLSRIAWAVDWLTPLADAPGFKPETEALAGAAGHLSAIGPGGSVAALCAHVLAKAKGRPASRFRL